MNPDRSSLYRWFHGHPELANQEFDTTEKIKEVLHSENIEILETTLKTGAVAVIKGKMPGPAICLRADIDALPIEERTGFPFASENAGKMHACGHDYHITTILYAASLLQQNRDRLHGKVYVVFQPAEEAPGGASIILKEVPEIAEAEAFFGIHTTPGVEVGIVGITEGGVMASVDRFQVTLTGAGTHAAAPHLGNNPIPVMAEMMREIQLMAGRKVNPLHPYVISVTHAEAGNSWNIIPEKAYFEGTVRGFDEADRKGIRENIGRIVKKLSEGEEMESVMEWYEGPGSILNDPELCRIAEKSAERQGLVPNALEPAMLSDDFSLYLRQKDHQVKGIYLRIGTGGKYPLHHPSFIVQEEALERIPEFITEMIQRYLADQQSK